MLRLLPARAKFCKYAKPKPFSWAKPAYFDFSSCFTVQEHRWTCSYKTAHPNRWHCTVCCCQFQHPKLWKQLFLKCQGIFSSHFLSSSFSMHRKCRNFGQFQGKLMKKTRLSKERRREPNFWFSLLGKVKVELFWSFRHIKRNMYRIWHQRVVLDKLLMFVVCSKREATDRLIGGDDNASSLRGWVGFWPWNIHHHSRAERRV